MKKSEHKAVGRHERWGLRFDQLCQFKDAHGHLEVEDKALSRWCLAQRSLSNKGLLDVIREQKLTGIGFSWVGTWEKTRSAATRKWLGHYLDQICATNLGLQAGEDSANRASGSCPCLVI